MLLPAALFVLFCLWVWLRGGAARGYALCLLLGMLAAVLLMAKTRLRLKSVQSGFDGRTAELTAEVESISGSYYSGTVNAVLHVVSADGEAVSFRCEGLALPQCQAGEYITGRFELAVPDSTQRLSSYADGIALEAECAGGFARAGESHSFRAVTARIQRRLSGSLRRLLDENTGGVLAAMVTGDRTALPRSVNDAYRAAGLSHVLVVSGMHVSLLCGDILPHSRREQSRASRRRKALLRAFVTLLLVGVTGFTPSVIRAAAAVWISSLGVFVGGAPDALTSLGAAGFLMCAQNAYAVCDVGFELSFAAVLGTLAGAGCARRGRKLYAERRAKRMAGAALPCRVWRKFCGGLWETAVISLCASAATFPVLVLRGLSASLYALLSSVAVLWLVSPMMFLGLGAAFAGFVPLLKPLYYVFSFFAGLAAYLMDAWAVMVAGWPGAQIYFETEYAAIACVLLMALCGLAVRWRVRLRTAVPAVALAAAVAVGAGSALSRGVVHVELVGSSNAPSVVITQDGRAAVLFRGGASAQRAVENALNRRGTRRVELLLDMRLDPETPCTLSARQTVSAAKQRVYSSSTVELDNVSMEIYRTPAGCAVRLDIAGRRFAALSGTVRLAKPFRVDWLLAGASDPSAFRWGGMLSLRDNYRWMDGEEAAIAGSAISLRPGGGVRVYG